jgi:hypothetical protein
MLRILFLFILIITSCKTQKNSTSPNILDEKIKIQLDTTQKIEHYETDYVSKLKKFSPIEQPKNSDEKSKVIVQKTILNTNKESQLGQIIYKVPDTMKVFKNYEVIVRISKSQNNIEITENIQGKIYTKSIQTTSTMEVKLVDPTGKNFIIGLTNSEVQLVDSSYTEWRFDVKPIKSGLNKLNLVVSIIKDSSVKQVVLSDDILVKSNPPAQIQNAWSENWKWIFEKMIIPLAVWLFGIIIGRWSKKKRR